MDLQEYLAIADAIPAVRSREDVAELAARVLATPMALVDRRILGRRLVRVAMTIDEALASEVRHRLLIDPPRWVTPRLVPMDRDAARGMRGELPSTTSRGSPPLDAPNSA